MYTLCLLGCCFHPCVTRRIKRSPKATLGVAPQAPESKTQYNQDTVDEASPVTERGDAVSSGNKSIPGTETFAQVTRSGLNARSLEMTTKRNKANNSETAAKGIAGAEQDSVMPVSSTSNTSLPWRGRVLLDWMKMHPTSLIAVASVQEVNSAQVAMGMLLLVLIIGLCCCAGELHLQRRQKEQGNTEQDAMAGSKEVNNPMLTTQPLQAAASSAGLPDMQAVNSIGRQPQSESLGNLAAFMSRNQQRAQRWHHLTQERKKLRETESKESPG